MVKVKTSAWEKMAINNKYQELIWSLHLEEGEITPAEVVRTLKVGKEWRNDKEGRRHSRKGNQKMQNGKMPGLSEGYKHTWLAGVKDPSWGTEIKGQKGQLWKASNTRLGDCESLETSEQGDDKTKAGEGKDWDWEQLLNTQEAMRTWTLLRCVTREVIQPLLPTCVLRPHCPPSVHPICQLVLSWAVSLHVLWQLFSGLAPSSPSSQS